MSYTIYLATPTFNSGQTIDTTILSVLSQEGDFHIRYHIQDAGSDDNTWHRLKHWQTMLDGGYFPIRCRGITFTFTRETDAGMYDGLSRAFNRLNAPKSGFVGWINSDDWFNFGAFSLVQNLAAKFDGYELPWITGSTSVFKNHYFSNPVNNLYPQSVVQAGLCDGKHWPFLQQEGTFFRQELLDTIDLEEDFRRFGLAGDWNLWRRFADIAAPTSVQYPLAVFRSHEGQLTSTSFSKYVDEINTVRSEESRDQIAKTLDASPHGYTARIVHAPFPMTEFSCVNIAVEHPFGGMLKKR